MRTTLQDANDPLLTEIPTIIQACYGNYDVTARAINQATRILLPKGQWRGTVVRQKYCTSENCLTHARQVETIIAFATCSTPGTIRSHWYEFMGYGPGQISASSWCDGNTLIDRGFACAFDDICGEEKKIRVYCDNPNDAGKTILLQGQDKYRNWVLTNNGATNGELVTLAMPWVDTATIWMPAGLVAVQKQITKGPVRLFELDTTNALQKPLAIYEPDETRPYYRRSIVPGNSVAGSCCNNSSTADCADNTITVLAKLGFIPVRNPTDYLLIQNLDALQSMVQSLKWRADGYPEKAREAQANAIDILESELGNFHGDGTVDMVNAMNSAIYADCGVTSLV